MQRNPETLDELYEYYGQDQVYFIEGNKKFSRYFVPSDYDPDGASEWVCNECGTIAEDPTEGCSNEDCINYEGEYEYDYV